MEKEIIDQQKLDDGTYNGKEVRLCADGKYRWVYEVRFLRNPSIFLSLLKAMFMSVVIIFVMMVLVSAFRGDLDLKQFLFWLEASGVMMVVFFGLAVLTMLVMAVIFHGKYVVLFVMDDKQVQHIQMARQVKKNQVVGMIVALMGAASENPTMVGAGMLSASSNGGTSEFAEVRRVKAFRRLNLIKVRQRIVRNQIYVPDEDFDFVYNYIKSHSPKVK